LTRASPARRSRREKPSQRELSVSSSRACEAISLVALVSSSRAQRGDLPVGIGFVIASAAWRSPCWHWFRHRERSVAISLWSLVSSSRACEAISLVALVSSSRAQRGDLPGGISFVIASAAWRSPWWHWFRHRERSVAISLWALVSSSRAQRGDLPVGLAGDCFCR